METEQDSILTMPTTQAPTSVESGISRCENAAEGYQVYIHVLLTDCGTISLHEDRETDRQTDR